MTDIRVRPFTEKDIPFLIESQSAVYEDEFGFGDAFARQVQEQAAEFAARPNHERETLLIAEFAGERVGTVAVIRTAEPEMCELRWLLVLPEMRRAGVGDLLLSLAMSQALQWGYRRCFLWSTDLMSESRHMYGRFGFRITQTKENRSWTGRLLIEEKWEAVLRLPDSVLQ